MKLQEIKVEDHRKKAPSIRISAESNTITFTKTCTNLLNLEDGLFVKFYQDTENLTHWYLSLNKTDGYALRKHKEEHVYQFSRKRLVIQIFQSLGIQLGGTRTTFEIGEPKTIDGIIYYKLIPKI